MSENTFLADEKRSPPRSKRSPCWTALQRAPPHPPQSLVSALWFSSPSVIRSRGRKQPVEIGSPQQVLWLLFQVGGELVGRTSSAGISHCPLVLWHTRHFLPPRSRWLIFTAACVCNPGGTDSRQGQTVVCKCWVLFFVVAVVLATLNSGAKVYPQLR